MCTRTRTYAHSRTHAHPRAHAPAHRASVRIHIANPFLEAIPCVIGQRCDAKMPLERIKTPF